MYIESVELENIRSYVHERIEMAPGIAVFRGDIGAGKSTILQAIEFAVTIDDVCAGQVEINGRHLRGLTPAEHLLQNRFTETSGELRGSTMPEQMWINMLLYLCLGCEALYYFRDAAL